MPEGHEPAPASGAASLGCGEIHVWRIRLADDPGADAESILSEIEQQRAARFVFGRDRNRFVRARCRLRHILGRYLGIDPRWLPIVSGPNEKPQLAACHDLEFNLSHSGDYGLIGIGRAGPIGIDIEETKLPADARGLARSVFSIVELQALDGVPEDGFSIPFFTCWTRKEAVLKALGTGFEADPRRVTVGIAPERKRIHVDARHNGQFVDVETIAHGAGWIASVAVVGGFSAYRIIDDNQADQERSNS